MQWYYLSDSDQQIPVSEEEFGALVQQGVIRADTPVWREDMEDWAECGSILPQWFEPPPAPAAMLEQPPAAPPAAEMAPGIRPRLIVGNEADARTPSQLLTRRAHAPAVAAAAGALTMAPPPAPAPGQAASGAAPVTENEVQLIRYLAGPLMQGQGWMKVVGVALILIGIPYLAALGLGALFIWMGILLFQAAGKAEQAALLGHKHLFHEAQRSLKTFFTLSGVVCIVSIIVTILWVVIFGATLAAAFKGAQALRQGPGLEMTEGAAGSGGPEVPAPPEGEEPEAEAGEGEDEGEGEAAEEELPEVTPPDADPFG